MTVKETYHADCLRIKQLENQIEGYKGENGEQFERIEELEQQLAPLQDWHDYIGELYEMNRWDDIRYLIIKEFESEQNGNDK